jgi:hypothetical protein
VAVLRRDRFVTVDRFIDGLRLAASSVVRVTMTRDEGEPQALCSGWFITPHLIIVPGYSVLSRANAEEARLHVEVRSGGRVAWESAIQGPPETVGVGALAAAPDDPALALLSVTNPEPERVLTLCFEAPAEGDLVTLVHYPAHSPDPAISPGRIRSIGAGLLLYDASTAAGSSGAPVLDQAFRVVGIHVGRHSSGEVNQGTSRAALIDLLRTAKSWPTIAGHHRIADDTSATDTIKQRPVAPATAVEPALVRAAVTVGFERASLSESEQARLRTLVADPSAPRWTLRPADRRAIITAVGSLSVLASARRPGTGVSPVQRVVDSILKGPPYDWATAEEDTLGGWIQAVRWFEGVAPDLPTPSQVAKLLERRRVRSRLARIAGPGFRGRSFELQHLREWAESDRGPLMLTGVGGIGKSALVARFAEEMPQDTLLLWLDFDRADLAPDDADSVIAAIADQAEAQVEGFVKPRPAVGDWESGGSALGIALAPALRSLPPPVLVLDSFEAAQYAERYQELWPVLERLSEWMPALRVIVTGRAPVPDLVLGGRQAVHVHLNGLAEEDARAWLQEKGVTNPSTQARVLEVANGIPLILLLAVHYLEKGGSLSDVPDDLPAAIVAGYLYDRILDRVQKGEFKPLASGALVLRRLSADMIEPVLGGLVTFPAGDPEEWVVELSREVGLVEGCDVLRLRPEVRAATLELLERDRPDLVRKIDERAAGWYASQASDQPEIAAELVYHLLRLGRVADAAKAWRDGAGSFLMYADGEIRHDEARAWLQTRLGMQAQTSAAFSVETWEQAAVERIRLVRGRKHDRAVKEILKEHHDRTDASPLVFHEAFELRRAGDPHAARALLDSAGDTGGTVGRDRRALRALLAADSGDLRAADALLTSLESPEQWTDRQSGQLDALTIQAARIQLTTDIESEARLLSASLDSVSRPALPELAPVDVVLPMLKLRLRHSSSIEVGGDRIPLYDQLALPKLLTQVVDESRRQHLASFPRELSPRPGQVDARRSALERWTKGEAWTGPAAASSPAPDPLVQVVARLADLGWRRWWLAANGGFLSRAYQLARDETQSRMPATLPIVGTLAIFALRLGPSQLFGFEGPLGFVIQRHPAAREVVQMSLDRWQRLRPILDAGVSELIDWDRYVRTHESTVSVLAWEFMTQRLRMRWLSDASESAFILSMLAPDPLQTLVADLAGQFDRPA